ncbi:MAG: hypothetical protein HY801_06630 [Candidatus Lindowbacteria bacterium]|nr:hypothetical protein [Candidatus Lindowbacteria bacterium]
MALASAAFSDEGSSPPQSQSGWITVAAAADSPDESAQELAPPASEEAIEAQTLELVVVTATFHACHG